MQLVKENYKLIAIDLSKQQKLDIDPNTTKQINFTGNLDLDGNKQEAKEAILDFLKGTVKVLWFYFFFNIILI